MLLRTYHSNENETTYMFVRFFLFEILTAVYILIKQKSFIFFNLFGVLSVLRRRED